MFQIKAYAWLKQSQQGDLPNSKDIVALKLELQRMKVELKRTTEERDILKKAAVSSTGQRNTRIKFRWCCVDQLNSPPRTLPNCPIKVRIH